MIYSIEQIKDIITPIAIKYGIRTVFLFGSYARGEATQYSDIDLMIDTADTGLDSLFKLGALYEELCNALKKEVDFITFSAFEQPTTRKSDILFRDNVLKERYRIC